MTLASTLRRRVSSARRVGPKRWALVAEAAAALAVARARLRLQPFGRVARRLGTFSPPATIRDAAALGETHAIVARDIGWAVRTVAPVLPFRAVCIEQAIAARAMLRRRGIDSVLRLGVAGAGTADFRAHAWLDAGDRRVTGDPAARDYVVVGGFVGHARGGEVVTATEGAAWRD